MFKITVRAKTHANQEKIEFDKENNLFQIWLRTLPIEGRANNRIIFLLSKYFKVPKSQVKIVSGLKSRDKIVEIDEDYKTFLH